MRPDLRPATRSAALNAPVPAKVQEMPFTWPVGMGNRFRGVYDLRIDRVRRFRAGRDRDVETAELVDVNDPAQAATLGQEWRDAVPELELVRGAGPTLQAALVEILGLPAKLGSGYQRDLQRMKAPLFRAIDLAGDSARVMAQLVRGLQFLPENIRLDDSIHAAGRANRLVLEEGLSFRDAYLRVAADLKKKP